MAVAGKLLANLVDDQHIQVVELDGRHAAAGQRQQPGIAGQDVLGLCGLQGAQLAQGVFHHPLAKGHGHFLQKNAGGLLHPGAKTLEPLGVQGGGAQVLAVADGAHLGQAALVGVAEIAVGLHLVEHHHAVRRQSQLVAIQGRAIGQPADFHRLHAAAKGCPLGLRGDAELSQQRPLPLWGGTAVAAHGRDQKGTGAFFQ